MNFYDNETHSSHPTDFSVLISILDGQVVSVSNYVQTIWATYFYRVLLIELSPMLKRHNLNGTVKISTINQRIFLVCCTGNVEAEREVIRRVDDIQRAFLLFNNRGEV